VAAKAVFLNKKLVIRCPVPKTYTRVKTQKNKKTLALKTQDCHTEEERHSKRGKEKKYLETSLIIETFL
jgi:hypothetical protein